jgi:pyrroline-5-carboxylate reductase
MTGKLAILGGGKIGEALLSGLLRGGTLRVDDVVVVEKHEPRAAELREKYGVATVDVAKAAAHADTILIAVKPQDIGALLAELDDQVGSRHTGGLRRGRYHNGAHRGRAAQGRGRRALHAEHARSGRPGDYCDQPGQHADDDHLAVAERLLSAVGRVVRVPETQLDAVTALSGSGPAYFFFLVEAMIDAGILLGLPRALAAELIVQTAIGSSIMLRDSGEHPVQLREAVTSPGGTTIAAIRELENHGVRAALLAAIEAACLRSRELGAASA